MKAALASGHVEILNLLLERAMLNGRARPSKGKLRDLCIIAARAGDLSCVELLISKHGVDPYYANKGVHLDKELKLLYPAPPKETKEEFRHSVFYKAIMSGDSVMINHLVERASDKQLASLFRPEPREHLILIAAANGYEEIISVLDAPSIQREFMKDVLLRARFYNVIRQGTRTKAEEMLDQGSAMKEIPDRDGCSLLMHAAFHGLDAVVTALLKGGANPLRSTSRYGDLTFNSKKNCCGYSRREWPYETCADFNSVCGERREESRKDFKITYNG